MSLKKYRQKRDFRKTPEPREGGQRSDGKLRLVVHKHDASNLHYDLRLELGGVLKSWAVPKGPSLAPGDKRLAMHVEDHPLAYGDFEGIIPEGEYGAGTVMLWDDGWWEAQGGDPEKAYESGEMKLTLHGEKLKGGWALVRFGKRDGNKWLLIKERDRHASDRGDAFLQRKAKSVKSGRSLDEIAEDRDATWSSQDGAQSNGPGDPSDLPEARKQKMPSTVEPELCTLVKEAPRGDWLSEAKFDGYRILAYVNGGDVTIKTRHGKDWTGTFRAVADALEDFPVRDAVLDGEVVALTAGGRSDFQTLQNMQRGQDVDAELVYYVFDLLHWNGFDLRSSPLEARKEALEDLVGKHGKPDDGAVRFSYHRHGEAQSFYNQACRRGLEGIILKKAKSAYKHTRSRDWLKLKCSRRQEFVICGYTDPEGSRVGFGALVLGYHDGDGNLLYAGRVGTGFDDALLASLASTLQSRERKTCPFDVEPDRSHMRGVHWVTPNLVGEVAFTEWTDDGRLRHPAFQGLREDKDAGEVVRETPESASQSSASKSNASNPGKEGGAVSVAGVRLSHPEKTLFPEMGLSKQDLAAYYEAVADWLLPHVMGRPLMVLRCPEGRGEACFYQKHLTGGMPDAIGSVPVREKGKTRQYLVVHDLAGIVGLVQMGALEFHVWGSRDDRLDRPDRLIFDLDPDTGVSKKDVVLATRALRDRLADVGLDTWVRTSGGKGFHVVAPIDRRSSWDEAKAFTRAVASGLAKDEPTKFTATSSKEKRKGKVYIDYLRNSRGATAVCSYSTRGRKNAPVATPLRWDELETGTDPAGFTVNDVPARLRRLKKDPWDGYFDVRQRLTKKVMKAAGVKD